VSDEDKRSPNREDYQELLADAEAGRFSHLGLYRAEKEVKKATTNGREAKIAETNRQLSQLKDEEARLGRLYITGKIGGETYNQLRNEWQKKLRRLELSLVELERDASLHLDDRDAASALMAKISDLYPQLEEKQRSTLLQILVKRIIVDGTGEIMSDYELNSPFVYLHSLVEGLSASENGKRNLGQPHRGVFKMDKLYAGF
jgi:hypothetical protein